LAEAALDGSFAPSHLRTASMKKFAWYRCSIEWAASRRLASVVEPGPYAEIQL